MNTANHIPQDDLTLFALQFLPEQDLEDALKHLEHCEACRNEVARIQGDLATYAMTSEMHSPPAMARERLMRRVAKEKKLVPFERTEARTAPEAATEPLLASRGGRMFESYTEEPKSRGFGFWGWAGWAIAAGVAVVAGMQFHQRQMLQIQLDADSAKITQAAGESAQAQQVMQTLTDAGALQVAMHIPPPEGVPAQKLPEGHVVYLAKKGALVFVASNLLPPGQAKTYELWVLPQETAENKTPAPIAAGIFKPDSSGSASVVMPELPKGVAAKGFGVTIEDEGGSKVPTSAIVLVGL